jgi:hypothetical protein
LRVHSTAASDRRSEVGYDYTGICHFLDPLLDFGRICRAGLSNGG